MEPTPQDPTTQLGEATAGVALAGEGPERNGLSTYVNLAIIVLSGVVTGIAAIVGDGSTAHDSTTVLAIFAGLLTVSKTLQAIVVMLMAARRALPLIEAAAPLRPILRGAAVDPETARAARIALANVIDERGRTATPDTASPIVPPDEADQTKLAASDGDPYDDGEDQAAAEDFGDSLDTLDDVPGGADAPPIDDEPGAAR